MLIILNPLKRTVLLHVVFPDSMTDQVFDSPQKRTSTLPAESSTHRGNQITAQSIKGSNPSASHNTSSQAVHAHLQSTKKKRSASPEHITAWKRRVVSAKGGVSATSLPASNSKLRSVSYSTKGQPSAAMKKKSLRPIKKKVLSTVIFQSVNSYLSSP